MGKDWRGSILVCIPTFGYIHVGFFVNMHIQEVPIHRSLVWHLPVDMPVGEARNKAVEKALERGCEYVYFRDYDVLAPPTALPILIRRDVSVIGAMYASKQKPPWPLIIKDNVPTLDWDLGDLVKCDGIGMGCTLIRTDVFRKMEPPWFLTENTSETKEPLHSYRTEDMYFCQRLRDELDEYPYCDTGLSCVHMNFDTGERYYFDPSAQAFVWQPKEGDAQFVADVNHPDCKLKDLTTPVAKEEEK